MIDLGHERFLTPEEALSILRRLCENNSRATLNVVTPGTLSIEECAACVTVFLADTPIFQLDPATFRGGWCSGASADARHWNIDIDLHGEGCKPLLERLRYHRAVQLQYPPARLPVRGA
jgi:hypothetical protein